jgi:hypothetical protein
MHIIAKLGRNKALKRFIETGLTLLLILSIGACGMASPSQPISKGTLASQETATPSSQTSSTQNNPDLQGERPDPALQDGTQKLITAADLQRVATGLPTDPAEAALILAQLVYQADEAIAQAATGEILRRAGVPLVSTDGPVIGWPDDWVLFDAEVYIDFLPQIVNSVRAGDFYTPTQVTELLAGIFEAEQALPPDALVIFFAAWGKSPDDSLELRSAGAAVRALAAQRGQVFYPQADLTQVHIDQLTVTLLLAQITSGDKQRAQARLPGGIKMVSLAGAPLQANNPCETLLSGLNPGRPDADLTIGFLKKQLLDSIKGSLTYYEREPNGTLTLDDQGEPILNKNRKYAADVALESYNISMKLLSTFLLLAGATIKLEADQSEIHFHHSGGGHSGTHVNLTATAVFASTMTKQEVKCYALAGLELQPGGPMGEGFKIRWSVDQEASGLLENRTGKFVTTTRADSGKIYSCGTCGSPTDKDGKSTLELYTKTEPEGMENIGELQEGSVNVIAKLDKTEFPFKITDFLVTSEDDLLKVPAKKMIDLYLSAMKRAGLPSEQRTIKVTYHAPSIYTAKGKRVIFGSFFYYDLPVSVDLYTCSGLAGPWQGEGSFGTEESIVGAAMRPLWGAVFGKDLPPPGEKLIEQQNFMIDPTTTNWVPINTQAQFYGKMTLYPYERNYYKKYGKSPPHGESGMLGTTLSGVIEIYLENYSFADSEELGGTPFEVFIEAADSDPRCPGGEAKFGIE